ncbi:hypothetical protein ACQ0P2_04910, partial [Streptococcus canis]
EDFKQWRKIVKVTYSYYRYSYLFRITPEEVLALLPREYRKVERESLSGKLDKGKLFWQNFELFRLSILR